MKVVELVYSVFVQRGLRNVGSRHSLGLAHCSTAVSALQSGIACSVSTGFPTSSPGEKPRSLFNVKDVICGH